MLLLEGLLHYRLRKYDEAQQALEQAVTLDQRLAPALAALGRLHLRMHDDQKAIAYLEKAISLAPHDAESTYQLGVLLDRNGDSRRARQLLARAIELRAHYPDPKYFLAKIELREGRPQAALSLLQEAVKEADEQEAIHLLLARTYQALGLNREAQAQFATVRRLQQKRIHRSGETVELLGDPDGQGSP